MATSPQQISNLFKTLGERIADAHNKAKDIPVNTGGGIGLPDGVRGVAQLTVMEFIEGKKEEDKGKFYFRAAGVVITPQFHNGIKCAGKQTSILIPFFDTPKRQNKKSFVDHHWPAYRDLFAKLGVEQPPAQQPGENKEAASNRIQQYYQAATDILLKQKPYFEFHTWKGDKATTGLYAGREPNVTEFWDGRCEYASLISDPVAAVSGAPGGNLGISTPNGHIDMRQPAVSNQPQQQDTATSTIASQPVVADNVTVPVVTVLELDALAECIDADPDQETDEAKDAARALSNECRRLGITDEEISDQTKYPDWAAVVGLMKSKQQPTQTRATSGATATATVEPVKGMSVTYDGRACEITSVNSANRLVTLKGADGKAIVGSDKKLLKVSFDKLS